MKEKLIIYFDGICGLCNGFIDLLINIDRNDKLRFSPLQSEKAKKSLHGKLPTQTDSVVVITPDGPLIKSEAVFYIFRKLGGGWKILLLARAIPLSWRDKIYDWVAKRRYRIFGKRQICRIPTLAERRKFL